MYTRKTVEVVAPNIPGADSERGRSWFRREGGWARAASVDVMLDGYDTWTRAAICPATLQAKC